MLRFVSTQAIVLSQAQQKPKSTASHHHDVAPRTGRGFFSRLFGFLFDAQMRKAEREIERHRRFYELDTK
jgi:hypothetical protein